jgi:hypothetical protein
MALSVRPNAGATPEAEPRPKSAHEAQPQTPRGGAWDPPGSREQAIEYLRHEAEPSIAHDYGNTAAFDSACHLKDLGVSRDVALLEMERHFNPRCRPPWKVGEAARRFPKKEWLESPVNSAYLYATREVPVALSTYHDFAEPVEPGSIPNNPTAEARQNQRRERYKADRTVPPLLAPKKGITS